MPSRTIRFLSNAGRTVCILGSLSATFLWPSVGGSISGTVKDSSNGILVNAKVTVKDTSTGLSHATRTDSRGYYTFPVLPVGHYVLEVEAPGFREYERVPMR